MVFAPMQHLTIENLSSHPLLSEFNRTVNGIHELVTCVVDDSHDGMRLVRDIIDSHHGKKRNAWCLATYGQDGTLSQAFSYWRKYCGCRKRIGFIDGRIRGMLAVNVFDEIGYPDSAFVSLTLEDLSLERYVREFQSSTNGSGFGKWLLESNPKIYSRLESVLECDGWRKEYDSLSVEGVYPLEGVVQWWDLSNKPHETLMECQSA